MIDRDFEQVSEEHMKSMSKPEGPAQEHGPHSCKHQVPLWKRCFHCESEIPATPAPSQPAGAREWLNTHKRWYAIDPIQENDTRLACMERRAFVKALDEFAAQQTAAKDAESLKASQLIAVSFDPTQDASLPKGRWIYLDTALETLRAAERERDSLRKLMSRYRSAVLPWITTNAKVTREEHAEMLESCNAVDAALKAGKDGQQ